MLQDNVEGYRREITSLHERIQKLTATTQKQEQIINTMTQDLRGANEKLAVAEVISAESFCLISLLQVIIEQRFQVARSVMRVSVVW